jgi:hypothetical protein
VQNAQLCAGKAQYFIYKWCRGWDLNSQLRGLCEGLVGDVQLSCLYAATSPFFFLRASSCSDASLAGSEKVDKKMPHVWRIHFRRVFHWYPQAKIEMSEMRQHKKLESWKTRNSGRNYPALFMQRLLVPVLRAVKNPSFSFLFRRLLG